MKILQICNKIPFPPKDGGCIAMNVLTEGLIKQGHHVKVLAIKTPKHFIDDEDIALEYREKTRYQSVFIDTSVKIIPAFLNVFSSKSYNISRFYSKDFENALISLLKNEQFDLIQLETLFVTPYLDVIRKNSNAKVVLRSHNIEFKIWERLAQTATNSLKKVYLKLLAKRLKNYELQLLNSFDAIIPITQLDADFYKSEGCVKPILHIPFGVDIQNYKVDHSKLETSIFHLGSMDWLPNIDAVNWFLINCWAQILLKNPTIKLYLAGRNMPEELMKLHMENVVVEGEVSDAHRFMNSKSIMIVPLLSGGGMRVKIIEGMALGKTIVTTAIGAEGIMYQHGKDILIANTAEEFIDLIDKCIKETTFAETIARNARLLIEEKYDNTFLLNQLANFYKTLILK